MKPATSLRAQSSVYGKIEQLLIVFPGNPEKLNRKAILNYFKELFTHFGDRVTFIILSNYQGELDKEKYLEVSERFHAAFSEALLNSHLHPEHHMIHIPAPMSRRSEKNCFKHSEFIQDPFVVMQNDRGEPVLMESYRNLNPNNQYVTEQVAAATGMLMRPTELWVEGGNILIGNDFALVGKNLLHHNLDLLYPGKKLYEKIGGNSANQNYTPEHIITGMFKRQLGVRYLMWIGQDSPLELGLRLDLGKYKLQPFFHIDHFLTLAGMNGKGEELILIGKVNTDFVEGMEDQFKQDIEKINRALRYVAAQLARSGNRVAGPKFRFVCLEMGGKIISKEDGYRFVPYSYNNCHVEWFHGIKRIYMPKYPERKELEDEILKIIGGLGFPVFPFISYELEGYAKDGGSLHCLTKVLKCSPY
ncbi:MAG TPA: hypothetical protein ENJ82_04440 [Bacteroidetes bacterium]|nr:hypothetical protein [Bacteroidota bacterium]